MSKYIYKQVMRDYDRDKLAARKKYEKRLNEVYDKCPKVRELDKKISKAGIEIARSILKGNDNSFELFEELKMINKALSEEKKIIMRKAGFREDYLTDIYICRKCKDTGFIDNIRCECFNKRLAEKAYDMSNIKEILKTENFQKFDFDFYSDKVNIKEGISPLKNIKSIYSRCIEFTESFDKSFANLLLFGGAGLGKTFMCNCIAKELIDKGKGVFYITATELFKLIENERFDREENTDKSEILNIIFDIDLFILDDLGTEFQTALTSSEFFNIINTRFIHKKPVVISTNLSPENIVDKYSDRVVSRFYGNYDFLYFFGDDIRILKLTKGNIINK